MLKAVLMMTVCSCKRPIQQLRLSLLARRNMKPFWVPILIMPHAGRPRIVLPLVRQSILFNLTRHRQPSGHWQRQFSHNRIFPVCKGLMISLTARELQVRSRLISLISMPLSVRFLSRLISGAILIVLAMLKQIVRAH